MAVIGYWDSLSEAVKLTNNILLEGLVQEVYKEGGLWPMLPVMQLDGLEFTYNREVEPTAGDFLAIGEETQSSADETYTQVSASLRRYYKQWDLDDFITQNYKNVNDAKMIALDQVRKGVQLGLEDQLIYGDDSVDTDSFDGLHAIVAANTAMVIEEGSASAGTALNITNMYNLQDLIRPAPELFMMNRNMRNRFSQLALGGSTSIPLMTIDVQWGDIGRKVLSWDSIPFLVSDFITQTESVSTTTYSAKTGGATTTIFGLRKGRIENGGLCMLMGSKMLDLLEIPALENKDAARYRLTTYAAPALGSTKALGAITGITNVAIAA